MGSIRPDIHERFRRILAEAPVAPVARGAATAEPRRRPLFKTKLSVESVRQLRESRAQGVTLEALAQRFHVSISTVSRAANGTTWR